MDILISVRSALKKDVHDKYEEEKSIRGLDMQVSIVKIIKQNLVYIKV